MSQADLKLMGDLYRAVFHVLYSMMASDGSAEMGRKRKVTRGSSFVPRYFHNDFSYSLHVNLDHDTF